MDEKVDSDHMPVVSTTGKGIEFDEQKVKRGIAEYKKINIWNEK